MEWGITRHAVWHSPPTRVVTMSLKKYQNWLAHYLVSRRDGDHALAAELAGMICGYWEGLGNTVELDKWARVKDEHHAKIT